jgi:hypothetical protein
VRQVKCRFEGVLQGVQGSLHEACQDLRDRDGTVVDNTACVESTADSRRLFKRFRLIMTIKSAFSSNRTRRMCREWEYAHGGQVMYTQPKWNGRQDGYVQALARPSPVTLVLSAIDDFDFESNQLQRIFNRKAEASPRSATPASIHALWIQCIISRHKAGHFPRVPDPVGCSLQVRSHQHRDNRVKCRWKRSRCLRPDQTNFDMPLQALCLRNWYKAPRHRKDLTAVILWPPKAPPQDVAQSVRNLPSDSSFAFLFCNHVPMRSIDSIEKEISKGRLKGPRIRLSWI